ncbi:hypothetical protein H311_02087 [Anncaliia algerae PRA109]|nr:hypothetical protein H311_02087 [Anncaliia algerae PRA109]
MIFLNEIIENEKCYSFGLVIQKVESFVYIVKYNDIYFKIYSNKELNINEWIKFYGTLINSIIIPKLIVNLSGCDINLLIKSILYIRKGRKTENFTLNFEKY